MAKKSLVFLVRCKLFCLVWRLYAPLLSLCHHFLQFPWCKSMFVNKLPWLPQCPLPVGGHFVTVAVGNQMANWALCHVTSRHRGMNQSGQAILLSRLLHRFLSPLRSPLGPQRNCLARLTERGWLQLISSHRLIYIPSTWVDEAMFVCVSLFISV